MLSFLIPRIFFLFLLPLTSTCLFLLTSSCCAGGSECFHGSLSLEQSSVIPKSRLCPLFREDHLTCTISSWKNGSPNQDQTCKTEIAFQKIQLCNPYSRITCHKRLSSSPCHNAPTVQKRAIVPRIGG